MKFKEWLIQENFSGEWWIHEDGFADYADGDIGDKTHEGIVMDVLQSNIMGEFNIYNDDEYPDWDNIESEIVDEILDDWGLKGEEREDYKDETAASDIMLKYAKAEGNKELVEALDGLLLLLKDRFPRKM